MFVNNQSKAWVYVVLHLAVWVVFLVVGSISIAETTDLRNSRTLHLEEFVEGKPLAHSQNFWGLIWPIRPESSHDTESVSVPVSTDGCFVRTKEEIGTETHMPGYKTKMALCGPTVWHMHASCQKPGTTDNPAGVSLSKDAFLLMGYDMSEISAVDSKSKYSIVEEQMRQDAETCAFTKIRPLSSFVADSRSYSFIANGNAHVYLMTVLFMLVLGASVTVSMRLKDLRSTVDFSQKENNDKIAYVAQYVPYFTFFAVYVCYFVVWGRAVDQASSHEDKVGQNETSVWYNGDSCLGAVLLAWLGFSFFGWVVNSQSVTYRKIVDATVSVAQATEMQQLVMGADVALRMYPRVTPELQKTDPLEAKDDNCCHDMIVEGTMLASTFVFVLPFVVMSYVSAYKYNLDIAVQALFVGSVVLGFVFYILIIFSWVVELIPQDKRLIVSICNLVYLLGAGLWAGLGYEILVSATHSKLVSFYSYGMLVLGLVFFRRMASLLWVEKTSRGSLLKYLFILARFGLVVCVFIYWINAGSLADEHEFKTLHGLMEKSVVNPPNTIPDKDIQIKDMVWKFWKYGRTFYQPSVVYELMQNRAASTNPTTALIATTPAPST